MGYSHYWERPAVLGTEEEFEEFAKDCRKVFAYCENELGIKLANDEAATGSAPIADKNEVSFNGSDEQPLGIWTTYEEVVVPWPTPTASIFDAEEPVAGNWGLGGTLVTKRIAPCDNLATFASGSYEGVWIERYIAKDAIQLDGSVEKVCFSVRAKQLIGRMI
jgi:hypothetical protein